MSNADETSKAAEGIITEMMETFAWRYGFVLPRYCRDCDCELVTYEDKHIGLCPRCEYQREHGFDEADEGLAW